MKITLAATFVLAGLGTAPAFGTVTYLTQTRSTAAQSPGSGLGDPSQSNSLTAPDFGLFSNTSSASTAIGGATASQTSSMTSANVSVVSNCTASASNAFNPSGTSTFDITFNLDGPTPFSLVGNWSVVYGAYTVRLSQGATTLYESLSTPNSSASVNQSGMLPAGDYRLVATLSAYNGPGFDPASNMNVTLTVPSPGVVSLGAVGLLAWSRRRR